VIQAIESHIWSVSCGYWCTAGQRMPLSTGVPISRAWVPLIDLMRYVPCAAIGDSLHWALIDDPSCCRTTSKVFSSLCSETVASVAVMTPA
jgi:hypothetical protein